MGVLDSTWDRNASADMRDVFEPLGRTASPQAVLWLGCCHRFLHKTLAPIYLGNRSTPTCRDTTLFPCC